MKHDIFSRTFLQNQEVHGPLFPGFVIDWYLTVIALAVYGVWSRYGVAARQEELHEFMVVLVRRQDERVDIRRVLVLLLRAEELVLLPVDPDLLFSREVVRMVND